MKDKTTSVEVTFPKSGSYAKVGELIKQYELACKDAFETVRELKALGIGQPWIDVEYDGTESDPGVIWAPKDGTVKMRARIRLEVR